MGIHILEYAPHTVLFNESHLNNLFSDLSEWELRESLDLYRQHCLYYARSYKVGEGIRVSIGSLEGKHPSNQLISQLFLYVDTIVIPDPIFPYTYRMSESHQAQISYLGGKNQIDRASLAASIRYILKLKHAIKAGVVEVLPSSIIHEPPPTIPVNYSPNSYATSLPKDLLDWFHQHTIVKSVVKHESGGWQILDDKALIPSRAINVSYKNLNARQDLLYFLQQVEFKNIDKNSHTVTTYMTIPDEPPNIRQFQHWVVQSINKSAVEMYRRISDDIQFAENINSIYLNTSPFITDTINYSQTIAKQNLKADIVQHILDIELPILKNAKLDDLIDVREKYSDSFENFRILLERSLREVRRINDPEQARLALENISHELSEARLSDIDRSIKHAKQNLRNNIFLGTAGFLASVHTGGYSLVATFQAAANIYKEIENAKSNIYQNPAFFLWKIQDKY